MSCKLALDAATTDESGAINSYIIECKNAIADLIGYRSKGLLNAAKKAYKDNPTGSNKRKLEIAQRKTTEHNELFDILLDDMLLNASEINYDKNVVSPSQMVEDWRMTFAKRLRGEINPVSIFQGQRTIRATKNVVLRLIKKRKKLLEKGEIPSKLIWGAPPEFVAQQADRFGFMQKLINKALRLSDKDISITSKFSVPIAAARKKFSDIMDDGFGADQMKKIFNFNNSSLWGISGIDGIPLRQKGETEDILIVGETIINNVPHFKIKSLESDSEIRTVPKDSINTTDEELRASIIGLYRDELTNEIMDGQTRKIIPTVINKEITSIEDDAGIKGEEDKDFIRLKSKVIEMSRQKKNEGDDSGNRVDGVHTIERQDGAIRYRYRYIMVKQGEGANIDENKDGSANLEENYKTYLISKVAISEGNEIEGTGINYIGRTFKGVFDGDIKWSNESYTQQEVDKVFFGTDENGESKKEDRDGVYYRSNNVNDFGRRLNPKTGEPLNGTHTKQYVDYKEIENQPIEDLMPHVWELVSELRNQMDLVWKDISSKSRVIEKQREIYENKLTERWRKDGKSEKEIKKLKKEYQNIGGIDSRVKWNEKDGSIRTANTFAKKKAQNYVPQMYSYSSIRKQLQTQIDVIKGKLSTAKLEKNEAKIEDLELGLKHLGDMFESLAGDTMSTKMLDLANVPFMKHITAWTDQSKRRKDGNIYNDYLNHAYRNIHRNEIIVEMMDTIDKMSQVSLPSGSVQYMANRMKMAFGDADSRAITPWGREIGYQKTADNLNKLPKWMRLGITHDAASAEKMTKWFTTPSTMRFLGAAPALGNQTQIVNQIIQVGWNIYNKAGKEMEVNKEMWERVVQNTGVLNVLTMFSDVMMVDGDPDWNDFAFLPTTSIPNPLKMKELWDMLRLGRESFINSSDDRIDMLLLKLEMKSQGKSREYLREMQDIRIMRKEVSKEALDAKKGAFFDYYTLDENQSEEMIIKRFKALVGEVTDAKIKRWVTWKLSWWMNNAPGKDLFTFTGGEEKLRAKTVVMALMFAKRKGLLGNINATGNPEDIYMSDQAKKIGRDAVYNTQFGMTPMYLGEGFNGLGRLIFQYKQYPTLQSIYDYQTFKKFSDGNYSSSDGVLRLTNAMYKAGKRQVNQLRTGEKLGNYDPSDPNIDHEAIAMLRFLSTRVFSSLIASIISVIPFASRMIRNVGGDTSFNLIRSGESPAIGFVLRLSIWTALLTMNDDGDDEGIVDDILGSFKFLLLPVLFGFLLQEGLDLAEDISEFTDN